MALGVTTLVAMLPMVSSACQAVPDTRAAEPARVASAIERGSDVLIVGDSYTKGSGSYDGRHGWAQDLVADMGWDATIDGVGGTGYVATGPVGSSRFTYAARIGTHADLDPALVIVQGSQNDWVVGEDRLRTTVESTLRRVEQQWPDAVVVAVGPSAPQPRALGTTGIAAAVSAGARAAGVTFIDPLDRQWLTDSNSPGFAAADEQHLNDAGYRYLAGRLESTLRSLAAPAEGPRCA